MSIITVRWIARYFLWILGAMVVLVITIRILQSVLELPDPPGWRANLFDDITRTEIGRRSDTPTRRRTTAALAAVLACYILNMR